MGVLLKDLIIHVSHLSFSTIKSIFQACRGDKLDGGLNLVSRTQTDSGKAGYKIPTHADFLLAFSTFEGQYVNFLLN